MCENIIRIEGLTITANSAKTLVNNISLDIYKGEIIGLVGESGSGKTLTAKALAGLLPDNLKMRVNKYHFSEKNIVELPEKERRLIRGTQMGFIPQNTSNFLHPLFKIRDQMIDGYCYHYKKNKRQAIERAKELLEKVGFEDTDRILGAYPWELSGGMRQRINIAIAMMNEPLLLIADEPTTALDCTIQRQVSNLLKQLNKATGVSILFISHDLGLVGQLCDRMIVMYAGRIVEEGSTQKIFNEPRHPYTSALINAMPSMQKNKTSKLVEIPGRVPENGRDREECIFYDRCKEVSEICRKYPPLVRQDNHKYYCHHPVIKGNCVQELRCVVDE